MLKDTLKQIRTEMQLGQRDFGLKMHLNARTIWKLERGDLPHPRTLQRLATGLELKPQEMMEDLEWKAWRDRFPGEAVAFLDPETAPLCMCGCGLPTRRISHTKKSVGRKGEWGRYIRGHWGKWSGVAHDLSTIDRNEYMRQYRLQNLETEIMRSRLQYRKLKVLVIKHYSKGKNRCACCNEKGIEFLTIDHIVAKRGRKEADACGSGLYARLRSQGFPEGFQVLCFNCNCAKRTFDVCPHQRVSNKILKAN